MRGVLTLVALAGAVGGTENAVGIGVGGIWGDGVSVGGLGVIGVGEVVIGVGGIRAVAGGIGVDVDVGGIGAVVEFGGVGGIGVVVVNVVGGVVIGLGDTNIDRSLGCITK